VVRGVPVVGHKIQPPDLVFVGLALAVGLRLLACRRVRRLGALAGGVAALVAWDVAAAALNGIPRASLVTVAGSIYLGLVFVATAVVVADRSVLRRTVAVWIAVSSAVAALGIGGVALGWFGINTPFARLALEHPAFGRLWQLVGTLQSPPVPNFAFSYLHVGGLLALGWVLMAGREGSVLWPRIALGLHLVAILLTFSRGWVAFLIGAYVVLRGPGPWWIVAGRRGALAVGIAGFLGLQVLSYVNVESVQVRWRYSDKVVEDPLRPGTPWFRAGRLVFLTPGTPFRSIDLSVLYVPDHKVFLREAAFRMIREYPLAGTGPGMFPATLMRYRDEGKLDPEYRLFSPRYPHSTYLGFAAERGIVGLGLLAVLGVGVVVRALRNLHAAGTGIERGIAQGLLGILAGYVVFAIDADVMQMRWLWVVAGLVAVGPATTETGEPGDHRHA